jgi:hypothetical protein
VEALDVVADTRDPLACMWLQVSDAGALVEKSSGSYYKPQ